MSDLSKKTNADLDYILEKAWDEGDDERFVAAKNEILRRITPHTPPPPEGTVPVRIAVVADEDRQWNSAGWQGRPDDDLVDTAVCGLDSNTPTSPSSPQKSTQGRR